MIRILSLLTIISGLFFLTKAFATEEAIPLNPRSDQLPSLDDIKPFKPQLIPKLKLPKIEETHSVQKLPPGLYFTVDNFEFVGNRVFSDQELNNVVEKYRNRKLTSLDLEELRLTVTKHYIDHGYINSGTLIPDQDLANNTLILKIIEGKLSQINVRSDGSLKTKYYADRISLGTNKVLNISNLQENLFLLQQNPRVKQINAALEPGAALGESVLDVNVTEEKLYKASFQLDNYAPPSIGEVRGTLDFTYLSLSGVGDTINVYYRQTEGAKEGGLYYLRPITPDEILLRLEYVKSAAEIIDENAPSGISSKAYTAKAGIYFPIIKTANEELNFEVLLDRRQNKPGSDLAKGFFTSCKQDPNEPEECNLTALRVTQSWLKRNAREVYFLRHTMSIGLNMLNATISTETRDNFGNITQYAGEQDSQFVKWLGQFQWAKRFSWQNIQTLFRSDLQISNDSLMSMEKLTVGGVYTVRGYRENQLVRDNGFIASLEARLPIFRRGLSKQQLQAVIFTDYGIAKDRTASARSQALYSVGLGLKYDIHDRLTANLYWAHPHPLKIENTGDALQDKGWHMAVRVELF